MKYPALLLPLRPLPLTGGVSARRKAATKNTPPAVELARRIIFLTACALLVGLLTTGCDHDEPVTSTPARGVHALLLGDWVADDGATRLLVRQLDDSTYLVVLDDDVYRARHADFAGLPLIAAESLAPGSGRFAHVTWRLFGNDDRLEIRRVSPALAAGARDAASLRRALEKHRDDPDALGLESLTFTRRKKC